MLKQGEVIQPGTVSLSALICKTCPLRFVSGNKWHDASDCPHDCDWKAEKEADDGDQD